MLYIAYLNEFGYVGPYIAHDEPRHKTCSVFGLGGLMLPFPEIRRFSTYFIQLKNRLLKFELERSGDHPAKWEKKSSALYTINNIEKYFELRQADLPATE